MHYRLTIYVIIISMSEQVKQTIALYNYIDESPYLSQSQAEDAREYARVGEWAISLEHICLCVASHLSKQNKHLTETEIKTLETLATIVEEEEGEAFHRDYFDFVVGC